LGTTRLSWWICWRTLPRVVAAALLALFAIASGHAAEPRGVALVIGNGEYRHLPALPNPANDARAVEALLSALGFETELSSDRDARRLARDLDAFVDDAKGADVAVLYYSGHGIEAGGENLLVPVDADPSALDAAGGKLVPLSRILDRLRATVPVTIILLDACRSNPFPPGALVRLGNGGEPVPMAAAGLGEARGATRLGEAAAHPGGDDSLGTVVAFSAAPGQVALDGDPGGNSPYTAAVLRHLDAMKGEEFGTVMRMVAEEVYLKTGGRQRPWINENLRRLIYFGGAPARSPETVEGEILAERRQLLVTIAALPDLQRAVIERAAAHEGVPMDAVFGLLRTLGETETHDPARLEAALSTQTARLRELLAERAVLRSTDPRIVQLSGLAARALDEGALNTAVRLHEQAKRRVAELDGALDDVEAELRRRRLEFAKVYADSGAAHELAFDFRTAAADYEKAFAQAERWDDALAWDYRRRAVIAGYRTGEYEGDAKALEAIVAARDAVLAVAARVPSPLPRAEADLQIANALQLLGSQRGDVDLLREAAALYERAIPVFRDGGEELGVRRARTNLASALASLGVREAEPGLLQRAVAIHRELAGEFSFAQEPKEWTTARINLAAALSRLGERSGDTAVMREVADIFRDVLKRTTQGTDPILWAMANSNLAGALSFIGRRDGPASLLVESVTASQAALQVFTRETFPLYWASVTNNIGNCYLDLGRAADDETILQGAVISFEDALLEWRRDRVPNDWALATNNLANAVKTLAQRRGDLAGLRRAVDLYAAIMEVWTRPARPLDWGTAQNNMGDALYLIGKATADVDALRRSLAAFQAAQLEWTYERLPYDWAVAENNRGGTLVELGALTADPDMIRDGITAIRAAWTFDRESGEHSYDAYYQARLADAEARLDKLSP
jgi:uncharacterized caspase-like protein